MVEKCAETLKTLWEISSSIWWAKKKTGSFSGGKPKNGVVPLDLDTSSKLREEMIYEEWKWDCVCFVVANSCDGM